MAALFANVETTDTINTWKNRDNAVAHRVSLWANTVGANASFNTLTVNGDSTHGGDVLSDSDSTNSLGATGARWDNTWTDNINGVTSPTAQYTTDSESKLSGIETAADVTDATNVLAALDGAEVVAAGFTGTLDGILGGGTPAAGTFTTVTTSGNIITPDTTTAGLVNASGDSFLYVDENSGGHWYAKSATGTMLFDANSFSFRTAAGTAFFDGSSTGVQVSNAAGPAMMNEAATSTNPTLIPNQADPDTGMGWVSANIGALVAGGVEALRWTTGQVTITGTLATSGSHTVGTNSSGNSATIQSAGGFQFKLNGNTASQQGVVSWVNNSGITTGNIWQTGDSTANTVLRIKTLGQVDIVPQNVGIDGTAGYSFRSSDLRTPNTAGPAMMNEAATSTNPTLIPNQADPDTGLGWVSADIGALVAGGVEALRWDSSGDVFVAGEMTASSSRELKTNIETLTGALSTVEKLRGVMFDWKKSGRTSIGMVYDEVLEVVPELTTHDKGHSGVNYQNTVALLIEAVKELSTKIKVLENS